MSGHVYYHYTSAAGALGILSSRCFWLTDYRFLNDRQEIMQPLVSFTSTLSDDRRLPFETALRWHDLSSHHCVLSLSESPKILSQWRAYAADGRGFALGISESALSRSGLRLVQCQYETTDEALELLKLNHNFTVEQVYEARAKYSKNRYFMNWVESHFDLFDNLISDLIGFKNPAFREELEYRAVKSIRRGEASVRSSGDLLIPYTAVQLPNDSQKTQRAELTFPELWLGPKCSNLNRTGLHALDIGPCLVQKYDCGYN